MGVKIVTICTVHVFVRFVVNMSNEIIDRLKKVFVYFKNLFSFLKKCFFIFMLASAPPPPPSPHLFLNVHQCSRSNCCIDKKKLVYSIVDCFHTFYGDHLFVQFYYYIISTIMNISITFFPLIFCVLLGWHVTNTHEDYKPN